MSQLGLLLGGFPTKFPYGLCVNPFAAVGAADVIPVTSGVIMIDGAGIDAMTLGLPKAGSYGIVPAQLNEKNNDGDDLIIISNTAFAHTLTTPALGFNRLTHIATFAALISNYIHLKAYKGTWMVMDSKGITLT